MKNQVIGRRSQARRQRVSNKSLILKALAAARKKRAALVVSAARFLRLALGIPGGISLAMPGKDVARKLAP
jgi:hypothetical protein